MGDSCLHTDGPSGRIHRMKKGLIICIAAIALSVQPVVLQWLRFAAATSPAAARVITAAPADESATGEWQFRQGPMQMGQMKAVGGDTVERPAAFYIGEVPVPIWKPESPSNLSSSDIMFMALRI